MPSFFVITTSSLSICEASPRWLAYRHSWLMATRSLLAKKDNMPRSERERTANCQSTRLDVQTCNLATASQPTRTCSTFISFSTINSLLIYADFRLWFELYRFAPHLQNDITVRTPHECPCDRLPTMALSETATSDNCLYCCLAVPLRASAMTV